MNKERLNRLIARLAVLDIFVGLAAYLLQPLNSRLTWVFIVALVLLFWLVVAKVISGLEALIH